MEIKIGVQNTSRELIIETDAAPSEIEATVADALAKQEILKLVDHKGRIVLVPSATISYIELGSPNQGTVGFR